jgi:uncharacterized protein YfaP (DUF2135 family)
MKVTTMRTLFFSLILVLVLAGCNFGNNINVQQGAGGGLDITVTLSESDVNQLLSQAIASNPEMRIEQAQIDLQPGALVINGNVAKQDGTTAPGSITMSVGMGDGRVNVQVTSVNVDGFTADDARIADLNQRIADALNTRAQGDNTNAQITAVNVTEDGLTLTINVRQDGQ